MTNFYFYRVELFYSVIDIQFQEFNNHFGEVNINLLLCMTCLNFNNSFSRFDVIRLREFYF